MEKYNRKLLHQDFEWRFNLPLPLLFPGVCRREKKIYIEVKGGYSSVRRVVDQLEPRPWPFDDRTSTREVAAAYAAPVKFDDPPPGKSNGGNVRMVDGSCLGPDVASSRWRREIPSSDQAISGLRSKNLRCRVSQSSASLDGSKDRISPAIGVGPPR